MTLNMIHGEALVERVRAWEDKDGNRHTEAGALVKLLSNEIDALMGLAEYLAGRLVGSYCELTALPGEADPNGPCRNRPSAVRWQDDFADYVCQEHAERVAVEGAIVIKTRRRASSSR